MKQLMILAAIMVFFPFGSCKKIRNLANISVNIPYKTQVTVPEYQDGFPMPHIGYTATIGPMTLQTNSKQYIEQYNTSPEKIVAVTLTGLTVSVLSPETESMSFADTIELYMNADGLPPVLAAYHYGRPTGDSVSLTCTEQNLKEYFLKDEIILSLRGNFNRLVEPNTRLEIASIFNMVANPLY